MRIPGFGSPRVSFPNPGRVDKGSLPSIVLVSKEGEQLDMKNGTKTRVKARKAGRARVGSANGLRSGFISGWNQTVILMERNMLNYSRNLLAYGVRLGMYRECFFFRGLNLQLGLHCEKKCN